MPRCYMVKKALCNKYINSVARGFESRGRGRSTPSPTNVQPDSPLKANPSPVALEEKQTTEEGAVSLISSEFPAESSSNLSLKNRLQEVQNFLEESSDEPTLLVVKPSSPIRRDHDIQQKQIEQPTEKLVEKASPSKKCTIITINTFPQGQFPIIRKVKDIAKDQSTLTLVENSPLILVEKPVPHRFHKVQDVIENAIEECTETLAEKFPPIQLQKKDLKENVRYKCLDSSDKFPSRRLKKVQDIIEDVIEQCTPAPTVTTATTTVITRSGTTTTTILQPPEFRPPTSPPPRLEDPLIKLESTRQTKVNDDLRPRQSSPASSTEGCTSRLEMLAPFRNSPSLSERFSSSTRSVIVSSGDYQSTNDGLQLFRDRSAAETEAAHDLLELSRSLPPLPQPGVAIGPQNVVEAPATDVQEMRVYQRETPVYQVNTIFTSDLINSGIYHHHQGEIIYEPTTSAGTIVQQAPGGVFIPLTPVQEILFTYATPSVSSIIAEQSIGPGQSMIIDQSIGSGQSMIIDQSIGSPSSSIIVDQSLGPLTSSRMGHTIASMTPTMIVDQSLRSGTPSISGSVMSTMIVDQSVGAGSSRIEGQSVGSSRSSMMAEQSLRSGTSSISGTSMIVAQSIGAGLSSAGSVTSSVRAGQSLSSGTSSISGTSMIVEQSARVGLSSAGTVTSTMRAGQSIRSGTPSISGASIIVEQSVGAAMSSAGSDTSSLMAGQSLSSGTSSILGRSMIVEQSVGAGMSSAGSVTSMGAGQSLSTGTSSILGRSMIVEQSVGAGMSSAGSVTSMQAGQSLSSGTPSISGASIIVEQSIGAGMTSAGSVTSSMRAGQSSRSGTPSISGSSMIVEQSLGSIAPSTGSVTSSMFVRQSTRSGTSSVAGSSLRVEESIGSVASSRIVRQSVGSVTSLMLADKSVGSTTPSDMDDQLIGSITPLRIVRQSVGSMTSRILDQSAISVRSSVTHEQSAGPMTPTSIGDQSVEDVTPSRIIEPAIDTVLTSTIIDQPMETVPPLTPPISECSSDIENNNPNWQTNLKNKEVQTINTMTEQPEAKVAAYTYDTLLVTDGRSKNKKGLLQPKDTPEAEPADNLEVPKAGRYVCCECGKQYATSSNLSRHKQTHRSIDSQSAKKCVYCGKAYVSMPALAMHVLTHKLTHSCGICGKMFSRPWLLQGHLRSHTGEKPYGCAHCGKAFADRSNLRAHMQTHSADKNYECPKCGKSFALKSYLNKHLESACQRENGDDSSNDVDSIVTL